jgi:hypothetical protein
MNLVSPRHEAREGLARRMMAHGSRDDLVRSVLDQSGPSLPAPPQVIVTGPSRPSYSGADQGEDAADPDRSGRGARLGPGILRSAVVAAATVMAAMNREGSPIEPRPRALAASRRASRADTTSPWGPRWRGSHRRHD